MFEALKIPQYTYNVSYEAYHTGMKLWVKEGYKTTDDAVEIHRTSLKKREASGTLRKIRIARIPVMVGV